MSVRTINSPLAMTSAGGYSQAVEITNPQKWLLVSGQIPEAADGTVAPDFASQCRQVWRNIEAQLLHADMNLQNIVKVTTYLSSRRYTSENSAIRREFLGTLTPALTVLIAGIYDELWLLEIEVIACV
jgi:2-iminobutanoate/2-iminopropanoate deaminase